MNTILDKLNRYRLAQGWSYTRMAAELCIESGRCTRNLSGKHDPHDYNMREYRVWYEDHMDEIEVILNK